MGDALKEQRVNCRRCRYRFAVQAPTLDDWRVEAQCPACDGWACFTAADTLPPPHPDPEELDAATQRLAQQLWQPINEHRSHPAIAWMDRVGNGMFEDDSSGESWPVPCWVYRFTHRAEGAYVWQEGGSWFVRGWHALRGGGEPPDPEEVFSFEAALDRLAE
jgi:hypothetical protein